MYESERGYYRGYGSRNGYEAPPRKEPEMKPEEAEVKVSAYYNEPKEMPEGKGKYDAPACECPPEDKKEEKDCYCKDCEFYEGNSVAFEIRKDDCEIRADIIVKKNKCIRIWGRVKSCYDEPVEGAMVKLVKVVCWHGKYQYVGVAHTLTDCKGFYQFDICGKEEKGEYRVIVSKSATGKERVIGGYGCCKYYDEKDAD